VHLRFQGKGVATLLLRSIEEIARELKVSKIITEASITARPFFEKKNFLLVREQLVEKKGVFLKNFVMEKYL
ncbi:MAG: GNAT family N-acetyltransferase, partial [Oligoflexia bacterium]|nr:GNAT family N-acetyltransferase [Oligoflexia bacterium]